jgi:hypothetical protein
LIIWDEPEIGMGEELQLGVVNWFFKELENWPAHTVGIVMMTHSRIFVKRAMAFEGFRFLSLDGYKSANEWLKRKVRITGVKMETSEERFESWWKNYKLSSVASKKASLGALISAFKEIARDAWLANEKDKSRRLADGREK